MPRGGARPGAGRPRKHPKPDSPEPQKQKPPGPSGPPVQPLEYMLGVMNDPDANPELRARMAVAAAPYVHPKIGEQGKKDQKNDAAKKVAARFAAPAPPPRNAAH